MLLAPAWALKACAVAGPLLTSVLHPRPPRHSAFLSSFFFFYVGRSFISVAIVANTHVHCPQFQRQQKDNPGLLYTHGVFHTCLDFEDMHVVN